MSAPETEAESCFIDTNIWLYAFIVGNDPKDYETKPERSRMIHAANSSHPK